MTYKQLFKKIRNQKIIFTPNDRASFFIPLEYKEEGIWQYYIGILGKMVNDKLVIKNGMYLDLKNINIDNISLLDQRHLFYSCKCKPSELIQYNECWCGKVIY